jgi:histidinol-phosphatase
MMVAEGSVDVAAEAKLAIWDVAALIPIVEGAGGMITGMNGESPLISLSAFTSNAKLHPALLTIFQSS